MKAAAERLELLTEDLSPVQGGPFLWRINGCGLCLLGQLNDELLTPHYLTMYWFTFFWIPIVPLGTYVVERKSANSYFIKSRLGLGKFHSIYTRQLGRFYLSVARETGAWLGLVFILVMIIALMHRLIYGTYWGGN